MTDTLSISPKSNSRSAPVVVVALMSDCDRKILSPANVFAETSTVAISRPSIDQVTRLPDRVMFQSCQAKACVPTAVVPVCCGKSVIWAAGAVLLPKTL